MFSTGKAGSFIIPSFLPTTDDFEAIMVCPNIIIFGDPAMDRGFVVSLLTRASPHPFGLSPRVFQTQSYSVTISNQQYWLYNTAGIPSSGTARSSLQAREVLGDLYRFIHAIAGDGGINLLIYVVRTDKPTSSNFKLFYDYLCQQDTPIILVQTTHTPSKLSWFKLVLTLDGANRESDKVNLHTAIDKHVKKTPKSMPLMERFESTARGCWKLLEKEASWSVADCRDALKFNFKNYGLFSEKDADRRCESIIKGFQRSLKKQSAIDKIQQRVDAVLSTVKAVGNVAPIPFVSVAAQSAERISETVQVCAITNDFRS
jgi:hypothetical protein